MSSFRHSSAVLDEEYLPIRAKLLEIAASLDRVDRADGEADENDPRVEQIRCAIDTLLSDSSDRAEKIQLIFSLDYEKAWLEKYRIVSAR